MDETWNSNRFAREGYSTPDWYLAVKMLVGVAPDVNLRYVDGKEANQLFTLAFKPMPDIQNKIIGGLTKN